MRELFFTQNSTNTEVQENKSQIINYINSENDSKALLDLIFTALKSDKHEITDETLLKFLRKQENISIKLEEIYKIKFLEFYKNVNEIKYSVPPSYIYPSATQIQPKKPPKNITHLTLFTYFLFFARKYLLDNTDKMVGCPINKYITDVSNQINTNSSELTVVNTISNTVASTSTYPFEADTTTYLSKEVEHPNSFVAKIIRLILIDSSKSITKEITKEDIALLETINTSNGMKNFILKSQKENWNYKNISPLVTKLNGVLNPPPDKNKFNNDEKAYEKAYEKYVSESIKHGYELNTQKGNLIKKFLLNLMTIYILSYKVQGVAPGDTNGKLEALYPIFLRILNPVLNNKTNLFDTIGINEDDLKKKLGLI